MNICDRLKLIRGRFEESQAKFSKRFGIAQNTWGQYEIGKRSIPDDLKSQLANMGINIHWLVTGDGAMYLFEDFSTDGSTYVSDALPESVYNHRTSQPKGLASIIPELESIPVPLVCQKLPAGLGQMWGDDSFTDAVIAIPTKMLKRFNGYKFGGAEVLGDSMQPTISNGDIVIFAAQMISGNGVYVLSIDNEVFVKRLEFDPIENMINIISDNEKYLPRLLPRDTNLIQILGKVIGRFMQYW